MLFHKSILELKEFEAGDKTLLREVLHPKNDLVELPYSLAFARLEPNTKSLPHILAKSSELYIFQQGEGIIFIEQESRAIKAGDIVLVPKGAEQYVENTGNVDLEFLCLVAPAWKEEEERIL